MLFRSDVSKRAILHEESLYPSPFEFSPERYLSHSGDPSGRSRNGSTNTDIKADYDGDETLLNPDPARFAFGYGRR